MARKWATWHGNGLHGRHKEQWQLYVSYEKGLSDLKTILKIIYQKFGTGKEAAMEENEVRIYPSLISAAWTDDVRLASAFQLLKHTYFITVAIYFFDEQNDRIGKCIFFGPNGPD